jgi:hypothetical protein
MVFTVIRRIGWGRRSPSRFWEGQRDALKSGAWQQRASSGECLTNASNAAVGSSSPAA